MKKRIMVVSIGDDTGEVISNQLKQLFGERVSVDRALVSMVTEEKLQCDLLLLSNPITAKLLMEYCPVDTQKLVAMRVINHKRIGRLISLPENSHVLLVNDSENTAKDAERQLKEIGLDHLIYHRYYPGLRDYPKLDIVCTPGENHLIPYPDAEIIDIGSRILDIRTLYRMIELLGLSAEEDSSLVTGYLKDIVKISKEIEAKRKAVLASENLLDTIVNSINYGLAYVTSDGNVLNANQRFLAILNVKKQDLIGHRLSHFISWEPPEHQDEGWLIRLENRELFIQRQEVSVENQWGYLITLQEAESLSRLGNQLQKSFTRRFERKLHGFEDYLSWDRRVKEMIDRARKFAKSETTVLIQGENGTGKEILAQAIHQHSNRRGRPFVPVNIAAITPTLLESELFGYSEGAFTGAAPGGKVGLFEIARGGTIFIDEIGEAPLSLQVKLLRVIEEKRIRPVGALEEVPVDLRIIAATNKNLLDMVDEGTFREDLYFRLNRLPLRTIPLRRRKEDIPKLLFHFAQLIFGKNVLDKIDDLFTEEAFRYLLEYEWRGNVRELINLIEYLAVLYEGQPMDRLLIEEYMPRRKKDRQNPLIDHGLLWMLRKIDEVGQRGIGRVALTRKAKEERVSLGEGQVRSMLDTLKNKGLISSEGDRRGSCLTAKGKEALYRASIG